MGQTFKRTVEAIALDAAIVAAILAPSPFTIGLALTVASSVLADVLYKPAPKPGTQGFQPTDVHLTQTPGGLPVPYGLNEVPPSTLAAGQYPPGQPAFGGTVIAQTVLGEASNKTNPNAYLWTCTAVC